MTAPPVIDVESPLGASHGPVIAAGRDVLIIRADKVVSLYVVIDAS